MFHFLPRYISAAGDEADDRSIFDTMRTAMTLREPKHGVKMASLIDDDVDGSTSYQGGKAGFTWGKSGGKGGKGGGKGGKGGVATKDDDAKTRKVRAIERDVRAIALKTHLSRRSIQQAKVKTVKAIQYHVLGGAEDGGDDHAIPVASVAAGGVGVAGGAGGAGDVETKEEWGGGGGLLTTTVNPMSNRGLLALAPPGADQGASKEDELDVDESETASHIAFSDDSFDDDPVGEPGVGGKTKRSSVVPGGTGGKRQSKASIRRSSKKGGGGGGGGGGHGGKTVDDDL